MQEVLSYSLEWLMNLAHSDFSGHSSTSSGGLCEVVWTLEADLAPGQVVYITGDPISLGGWQPDMALQMCSTKHAKLWKTEVKIPSGINFKYNYFIKEETWPPGDIIWRPGPEFSLSVPLNVKQDKKVMVRDSWLKFNTKRSPPHVWGSWIGENYLPVQPLVSAQARDKQEIVNHLEVDLKESEVFINDLQVKDELYFNNKHTNAAINDGPKFIFSEREQPVEEPWLLESSMIFLVSMDKIVPNMSKNNGTVEDGAINLDVDSQHPQVKDTLLPVDANNLILKDDSVSTIILINSSICTMQRIAVLEDGKLVELLLEPVKTNVQCDSVYLGVVTKFVPHMGGAFVNIGHSRPSLMDIKQNREPFIFPPFRQRTKKGKISSSGLEALGEHPYTDENEHTSHDVEGIDDVTEFISQEDLVPFAHDDHEEHEVDEDFDISEVKENVNGSIINYGEVDTHFEHFLDGREHHLKVETMNRFLPFGTEKSNDPLMSHPQDMKDSENLLASENKWIQVRKGTKIIVQVVKEGLGTKGPTLTAYPKLRSRFWILITRCHKIGISKKISGVERTRLKVIAKTLQPPGFGLTVRTVAAGHSLEELQKDLEGLLSTWKNIVEHAKSAALAADEGVEGAIPVILHRAMGQTLSVVQDYFSEKVQKMVVDSPRTYHEVTNYLQDIAPDLCDRVELYDKRIPLFDEFKIEEEINNILSKRVPIPKGGSLVIEQTEALVSIDVNGGHVMLGQRTSQEKAILDVNLAAAKQIARELRLRDVGGIIVVDFIDMADDSNKRLVYEEMKKAVEKDRSTVKVSELSKHGLMEITRKRVRPSVAFKISEPCTCCHATGRVEALETSFSKIEQEICRLLALMDQKADPENPKTWPRFVLRVDHHMCNYLTTGKRTRLAILSSSLKVWIFLKVARGFARGAFEVKPFTDDQANENQHQVAISVLRQAETRTINSGKKVTLVPVKESKSRGK
ncbi:ribonuclease E/G-like protein, chloroplastic isoform X2 [Hevea brasiliensis]|uniref:ribonuclease E/G-like protein, chloroplastic isoform X2 n=1 Tax=Hevea brasiliensis TaxID=3981 RepID=UPI0025E6AB11|nr:ribonuclease E/G-like protein, chloroplastic isoform X2 [Hevea brasiliensis]